MSVGERVDTAAAYWFEVHVDDAPWMVVQTVSGLGASWEQSMEIWEDASTYRVVPTKIKWSNIVLKGAVVEKKLFFDWFTQVKIGAVGKARKKVVINLKHAGKTISTWSAEGALPLKYSGPMFDASSTSIAFETIELTHLGLKREEV
jgi:phage tail-like protein